MKQILEPIGLILKLIGNQDIIHSNYRLLTYVTQYKVDEGYLVYNIMTRELILLDFNEYELINSDNAINSDLKNYLVRNWFFVPEFHDDAKLLNQVDSLLRTMSTTKTDDEITNFIIYPTTDCNARCFYCFELSRKRINMTETIAHDVASFIKRKSNGKEVGLNWFGGEPLYNSDVIDIICNDLKNSNVKYMSAMVSNGYLFEKDMIEKAKDLWNLKRVQITLDGTEKIYNKTKAYIYKNVTSPFYNVLNNIEDLLNKDIRVNIRLNLDNHNFDDLDKLIDVLNSRFKNYSNMSIYVALLYEDYSNKTTKRTNSERMRLIEKVQEINLHLDSIDRKTNTKVEYYRSFTHCMADDDHSTTILPDGRLGKCEHYTDDYTYGSIYSDQIDKNMIALFKKTTEKGEMCHSCAMYPNCRPLTMCPETKHRCDEHDKTIIFKTLENCVKYSYKSFVKNELGKNETE